MTMIEELEQLSAAWNKAWLEKDGERLDQLMTGKYLCVARTGQVFERRTLMETILSPAYQLDDAVWTEVEFLPLTDCNAVVIGRWRANGRINGNAFHDNHRCAMVCLRDNGAWKIAFQQCSPIAA
jgi:uncharacterized protein DUF4440